MAPAAFKTVYLFLALVALPQILAGPACAHGNYGKSDCVDKCGNHWGYGGHYMGHNKWGSVISSQSDPDSILSTACGSNIPGTPDPAVTPTDPSYPSPSFPPVDGHIPTPSVPSPGDPPHYTHTNKTTSSSTSSTPTSTSTPRPPATTPTPSTPTPSSKTSSRSRPPFSDSPSPPSTADNKSSPSPSPSPTPSSPPSQDGSVTPINTVTNQIKDEVLAAHNSFRALHGADALTWSDDIAAVAESWASKCNFVHSGGKYGENLAAGTGDFSVTDGIKLWTDEAKDYNPSAPQYSHFTQVVWKATKQVGCFMATCPPGSIFDSQYGNSEFLTCNYDPPGNVIGEFAENVQV